MIATPESQQAILFRLVKRGLNVEQIVDDGRFRVLDAAQTLASLSVRGDPRPTLFFTVMSELLTDVASKAQGQRIAIFGEMVSLLWEDGKVDAALALEAMWNALGKQFLFSVLCAYPMHLFGTPEDHVPFRRLCDEHTHVLPCESYTRLGDEKAKLRHVCELQQRARMADAALERLQIVEADLKEVEEMAQTLLEDSQGTVTVSELRGTLETLSDSLSMAKTADGLSQEAYSHLEHVEGEMMKLGRLMKEKLAFANPRWRN